ncbi:hypothetical protein DJ68_08715 [Halorubrum sp. C3]|nr:hypothetical protein DJ68_08715 [Halorubrum sp. C3]
MDASSRRGDPEVGAGKGIRRRGRQGDPEAEGGEVGPRERGARVVARRRERRRPVGEAKRGDGEVARFERRGFVVSVAVPVVPVSGGTARVAAGRSGSAAGRSGSAASGPGDASGEQRPTVPIVA